jgi:hypothetical protein
VGGVSRGGGGVASLTGAVGAWSGAREGRGACQLQDTPLSVPSPDLKAGVSYIMELFSGGAGEEFDVG